MKKILLSLTMLLVLVHGFSQGLENIIVERYYVSDTVDSLNSDGILPVGSITYRIYVDMAPGYRFLASYGSPQHHFFIQTSTSFFNNEFFGSTTANFSKPVLGFNSMMLDSWLSVGAACSGWAGVLKSEDNGISTVVNMNNMLQNNDTLAGIPLTLQDGMIQHPTVTVTALGLDSALAILNDNSQAGNLVYVTDGVWAALGGARGPLPTNRLLIAQLTTDGVLSFELNIQLQDTLTLAESRYVARNPTGNEIQFPGLIFSSNMAPQVAITSPTPASVVLMGTNITIQANATDLDGVVESVDFYVDGAFLGTDTSAPFTHDYLCTAGTHDLYCIAFDDFGDSTISQTVTFNVTTGISEVSFPAEVTVYPNPTSEGIQLSIVTEQRAELSCRLLNSLGQVMDHFDAGQIQGHFQTSVDMSSYPAGIYFLELKLGEASRTLRVARR